METPTKILAQHAETIAKRKAEFYPCVTCNGGGASIMKDTYIGEVEGQHGVCADCAGTGWANGKAWRDTVEKERLEIIRKSTETREGAASLAAAERAFADDRKRAEQALEMLHGLAAREVALARRAKEVEQRERDLADKQAQREQDNARALAALEEERDDIAAGRNEVSAVRDEVERYREEFRKAIKKLAKEVEALREVVGRLAAK